MLTLASFRVRLSLWNGCILAAALFAFGLTLGAAVEASLGKAVDADLARQVRAFQDDGTHRGAPSGELRYWLEMGWFQGLPPGSGAAPGPPVRPDHVKQPLLPRLHERPWNLTPDELRAVLLHRPRVLRGDGSDIAPNGSTGALDRHSLELSFSGLTRYSSRTVEGRRVRVLSVPYLWDGRPIAVVQVGRELTELDRLHSILLTTMLTVIPLVLLVSGVGGLFLTDRALLPVRAMTRAAAEISERDLSRRLQVTGRDELATLAATFNGMLARLEAAFAGQQRVNAQLRRFTADVSHELRTPLTRIRSVAGLALSKPREREAYREALQVANRAADAMSRLVQDLLLLSRSDAGQLPLRLLPTDLRTVVLDALDAVDPRDRHLRTVAAGEAPLVVLGDADYLIRLLSNLVENAVRYTPPGGSITIETGGSAGLVFVSVSDTGPGVPAHHLPHLCDRFYRVDEARDRERGGTGLGLSICKSIAEAHGGLLRISSDPGRGTTVTAQFPAADPGSRSTEPRVGAGAAGRVDDLPEEAAAGGDGPCKRSNAVLPESDRVFLA